MVELAAKTWGMNVSTTMLKLYDLGVLTRPEYVTHDAIAHYSKDCLQYRARVNDMWRQASLHLPRAAHELKRLQQKLRLTLRADKERWDAGPGKLLGALPHVEVEKTFNPMCVGRDGINRNVSGGRIFRGGRWGDVFVIPYYDLPDRIRGFQFVGRAGRTEDKVYKRLTLGREGLYEAGLAGLPSVEMAGNPSTVFATGDWLMAMQVQIRHFNTSLRPLPLVSWMDNGKDRTREAWKSLSGRRVIVWTFDLDYQTVMQAINANADIAYVRADGTTDFTRSHWIRDHHSHMTHMLTSLAVPWPKALNKWMHENKDGKTEQLLLALEHAGEDVSYILRQAGTSSRYIKTPRDYREVRFEAWTIIEQGNVWYRRKGPSGHKELLTNVTIHLHQHIKDRRTGQLFTKGELRFDGYSIHFIEKTSRFNQNVAKWLVDMCVEHNLGVPRLAQTLWSSRLYEIALKFHDPPFIVDNLATWVKKMPEPRCRPIA